MDLHVALLADAVSAVGSLGFYGGVPPQVVMNDLAGGGEVEAGTASFERQQQDGVGPAGLESGHHRVPLFP